MAEENTTETQTTGDTQESELDRIAGAEREVVAAQPSESNTPTTEIALSIWDQVVDFGESLLRPWAFYPVLIALGLLALAYALAAVIKPRFYAWLKTREGWSKLRYRYAMMVHRRMVLIVFNGLIWFTVWGMRAVTWPSRSYLLVGLAHLALAWLVVVVVPVNIVVVVVLEVVVWARGRVFV